MKLCKKCLLPENFPKADIDTAGLCGYCRRIMLGKSRA